MSPPKKGTPGAKKEQAATKRLKNLADELALLSSVLEHVPEAVYVKDLQGVYRYINTKIIQNFGRPRSDIIGKTDDDLWSPQIAAVLKKQDQTVLSSLESLQFEEELPLHDGYHRFLTTKSPYFQDGKVAGVIGFSQDITRQNETGRALDQTNSMLRSIIENNPAAIIATDLQGRILLWNPAAAELFGWKEEEVLGRVNPTIPPEDAEAYSSIFTPERSKTNYEAKEDLRYRKDGSPCYIRISATPLYDAEGKIIGRVASMIDVTHQKEIEDTLRSSEDRFRTLFEESPLILFEEDFSDVRKFIASLQSAGVQDFNRHFQENPQDLRRCAGLARLLAVNRAAREAGFLTPTDEKPIHIDSFLMTDRAWESFRNQLVAFIGGKTSYQWETTDPKHDGGTIYYSIHIALASGAEDDWHLVIVSLIDISERKQSEINIQQKEQQLRAQYDAIPLPTYTWHKSRQHFLLADCNRAALQDFGGRIHQLLGKTAEEIYHLRCPKIPGDIARCFESKTNLQEERFEENEFTGQRRILKVSYACVEPDLVLMHTEDITERRNMVRALQESELRYRSLFEHVSIPIVIQDFSEVKNKLDALMAAGVTDIRSYLLQHLDEVQNLTALVRNIQRNQIGYETFKETPQTLRPNLAGTFSGESLVTFTHQLADFHEGKISYTGEGYHRSGSGELYYTRYTATIMPGCENTWQQVVVAIFDLTEHKRVEQALRQSEQKFADIFNNSPVPMFILRQSDYRILNMNQAFLTFYGDSVSELQERDFRELNLMKPEDLQTVFHLLQSQGVVRDMETIIHQKNGEERFCACSINPVELSGEACLLIATADITERVKAETLIKAALAEKEALVKEVNHRVKNNLQVLISLIDLQSQISISSQDSASLKELRERVRSMAMIHERLYQSPNLSRIDFAAYIKDLTQNLEATYALYRNVNFDLKVEDVWLGVDTAIPCGLILHELVSNSLKYAFPPEMEAAALISIHFHHFEGHNVLEVRDNGIGLPQTVDWRNPATLGLQLVNILATHQLGGSLDIARQEGTIVRVIFPEKV